MSEQSRACFGQSGGQLVRVFVFPISSSTNTIQWSAPQMYSWSMAFGTLYIRSHFRHFTGVVPLRSKPDVVFWGVRCGAILKVDYTLLEMGKQ